MPTETPTESNAASAVAKQRVCLKLLRCIPAALVLPAVFLPVTIALCGTEEGFNAGYIFDHQSQCFQQNRVNERLHDLSVRSLRLKM